MYRTGIFSGDRHLSNRLERLIQMKYHFRIYKYVSEEELLRELKNGKVWPDILILDLKQLKNYVALTNGIQKLYPYIRIIFLAERTSDAFPIHAELEFSYLLWKPMDQKEFYHIIDKAVHDLQNNKKQMLELCFKNKLIRIPYEEIFYIESDRRYILIHQDEKTEKAMVKLSDLMEKMPDYFVRCHQSYAVNIFKIARFEKNRIIVQNGDSVSVSRNRLEKTRMSIEMFYGKHR